MKTYNKFRTGEDESIVYFKVELVNTNDLVEGSLAIRIYELKLQNESYLILAFFHGTIQS